MKIRLLVLSLVIGFSTSNASSPALHVVAVQANTQETLLPINGVRKATHMFGDVYLVQTTSPQDLANNPAVKHVYPNGRSEKTELGWPEEKPIPFTAYPEASFNDPSLSRQWSFAGAAEGGISVTAAYDRYTPARRQPIIVAVVDTGVDYNHPDLRNVMWRNEHEIAGNDLDDDQNGYVDDVYGIDTLERHNGVATGDPMDTHYHGTHVAGIIGAEQNNGQGIAGIASNVRIMAIRTVPNNGDETDVDVAESFLYAAKNGAKVINCSFGKRSNEGGALVRDTINHIGREYGVLVIAASGNDSEDTDRSPHYPSSLANENLLAVASTARGGVRSGFSNYGATTVDLGAPGSNIYATLRGGSYGSLSGTSMASPTTAGVAAEVLSHVPALTPVALKNILLQTVTAQTDLNGKTVSGGRIDLLKSIERAYTGSVSGSVGF